MSTLDPAAIAGLLFVATAIAYGLWLTAKEIAQGIRWLRVRRGTKRTQGDRRHLDAALERMGENITKRRERMAAHKRNPTEAPF